MKSAGEKITLNVGGVRFSTYLATLRAFPETKLCRLAQPQARAEFDYDPQADEFFFDRDSRVFAEVLNYCRTRHLHCPRDVCKPVFEEELRFWEVGDVPLLPCCWQREAQEDEHSVWDVDSEDGDDNDNMGLLVPLERQAHGGWRARWQPRCLAGISLLLNLGICALFIGKSEAQTGYIASHHYIGRDHNSTTFYHHIEYTFYQDYGYLLYLELLCILWFAFEFAARLTFCPDKKKFLRNPLNVADFVTLFPIFIELSAGRHNHNTPGLVFWLDLFRVLYILKLLKIFRLVETPLMLRVLPHTFRAILREIMMLLMVVAIEVLFFGALCYFAEILEAETFFSSIISAFWWAVVTLTTVGYGDMYPITTFGQLVAAFTAIGGVLTIVIPIPIFFIKFKGYYDAAVIREKRKKKKKTLTPSV
ncbi:hypothetical protein lerEdw1_010906 [Lerista edwardsae]|nr:hypothetical protein lerEdw1_010906 [Lerista edwardsae]